MKSNKFIFVIFLAGLMVAGFFGGDFISRLLPDKTGFVIKNYGISGTEHPYGRPFTGVLPWENDRKFHEFCGKNNISVRMAAFQTTLPDPLPGEEYNVSLAAHILASTLIEPGETFSMNARIGPYNQGQGFREGPTYMGGKVTKTVGGGVCKIATTLYNVTTSANLQILERHNHCMQVPYVPPGQDATVFYGSKDFKFRNNTTGPVFLWADTIKNTLYMAIYGRAKGPVVRWHHQILHRVPTHTIYQYNKNLGPDEMKVIIPGADGLAVRSWLTIQYEGGGTETRKLGVSYYNPLPELVERGK